MFYYLFLVCLRPSFVACATPSPNSSRNLKFLRRVGRLPHFSIRWLSIYAAKSVPTRRTLCEFLLNLGEMPSPRLNFIGQIQNGKEGLNRIWNKRAIIIRLSYEVSLVCVVRSYFEAVTSLGAARHSPRRGKLFPSAMPTPSPRGKAGTVFVG